MILSEKPAILSGTPIFNHPVPIARPALPRFDDMAEEFNRVLLSGDVTNGSKVKQFEKAAAAYLGVEHCVAVNSCTSGLLLTLRSLGIKGEVILPSFTFFATAHPVIWNGLTPVFVDCEPDTFNLNPAEVERLISEKTGAILAVHMYGNPAEMGQLEKIANKNKIPLILDAAHGFGSKYQGTLIGRYGSAEVFSLSPTKTVIACEGGLVATNDGVLARLLRAGRNYGDPGTYDPDLVGINARMSELHAIVALHSVRGVEEDVRQRNVIAQKYIERLSKLPGLTFQRILEGNRSSYKDFSILVDEREFGIGRDLLCHALKAEGIMTRRYFYPPVHRLKVYREYYEVCKDRLPYTDRISNSVLSLPIYQKLNAEVDGICSAIERIWRYLEEVKRKVGSQP